MFYNKTATPAFLQGIKTRVKQSKHKNYFIVFFFFFFAAQLKAKLCVHFLSAAACPHKSDDKCVPNDWRGTVVADSRHRQRQWQVAAVCHKPQVARKTEARNTHTHTHLRRQSQFTFMFMANIVVVVVVVAGTTLLTAFGFVLGWFCSRPFSILAINYYKNYNNAREGSE